ncbi:hypothetical protein B0H10DRAFT_2202041 [Mycena sp. CBHHK59/15]|nr:hypothetical protein B0H10DRAFT_2202041 [Mycena sp. CBHHK59/15]
MQTSRRWAPLGARWRWDSRNKGRHSGGIEEAAGGGGRRRERSGSRRRARVIKDHSCDKAISQFGRRLGRRRGRWPSAHAAPLSAEVSKSFGEADRRVGLTGQVPMLTERRGEINNFKQINKEITLCFLQMPPVPIGLVQSFPFPSSSLLTFQMSSQSRSSQAQPTPAVASVMTAFLPAFMATCFLVVPFPMMGMAPVALTAPAVAAATPEPVCARTPAPATAPPVAKPSAGLPTRLVALLRDENGPFLANEVFSATPSQPLEPSEEAVPAPEWYVITRGCFVGVSQHALSDVPITGIGASARKAYTTQALALEAFNQVLVWGGVQHRLAQRFSLPLAP